MRVFKEIDVGQVIEDSCLKDHEELVVNFVKRVNDCNWVEIVIFEVVDYHHTISNADSKKSSENDNDSFEWIARVIEFLEEFGEL